MTPCGITLIFSPGHSKARFRCIDQHLIEIRQPRWSLYHLQFFLFVQCENHDGSHQSQAVYGRSVVTNSNLECPRQICYLYDFLLYSTRTYDFLLYSLGFYYSSFQSIQGHCLKAVSTFEGSFSVVQSRLNPASITEYVLTSPWDTSVVYGWWLGCSGFALKYGRLSLSIHPGR